MCHFSSKDLIHDGGYVVVLPIEHICLLMLDQAQRIRVTFFGFVLILVSPTVYLLRTIVKMAIFRHFIYYIEPEFHHTLDRILYPRYTVYFFQLLYKILCHSYAVNFLQHYIASS